MKKHYLNTHMYLVPIFLKYFDGKSLNLSIANAVK